jgi:hypothetical protein
MSNNAPHTPDAGPVNAPCREIFDAMPAHAVVERFRNGLAAIDPRVLEMTDDQADRWFDASEGVGLWSCRALLTHQMDADVLYAMRLRRTLAEENPVFENWDEDAFLASRLCRPGERSLLMPVGAVVATIHTLRQTAATVLVQLDEDDWTRRAMNPYLGEVTLLEMLRYVSWHFEHHAAFLNAKANLLLGAPSGSDASWGGCGEGCACVGEDGDAPSAEA